MQSPKRYGRHLTTPETTRRRARLGIAIVKAGLIPKKVSALGIDADVNVNGVKLSCQSKVAKISIRRPLNIKNRRGVLTTE